MVSIKKQNRFFLLILLLVFLSAGCNCPVEETDTKLPGITEQEVLAAQQAWGESVVQIGEVYSQNGDYVEAAREHIQRFYGYEMGPVLFKPTLAAEKQFRTEMEGALSYFVGGNDAYPEDHGFALKPWSAVRWENIGTKIIGDMAVAMGNYYFTPVGQADELKVEYTFAYTKDEAGRLKILMHGSHLPYSRPEADQAH